MMPAGISVILVADDDSAVRTMVRMWLTRRGHDVICAADGEAAWMALTEEPRISAVVSDIQMPRLDGVGLCRRVRADRRFDGMPFVMFSSAPEQTAMWEVFTLPNVFRVTKGSPSQDVKLAGAISRGLEPWAVAGSLRRSRGDSRYGSPTGDPPDAILGAEFSPGLWPPSSRHRP